MHLFMTPPLSAFLLLAVLSPGMPMAMPAAHAASLVERAGKDETVSVSDDDPAMRKAFAAARSTLDDFLSKLKSPPAGSGGFAVKVGIRAGSDVEYMWIGHLAVDGERFSGRIDNEPRIVKTVKAGDTFAFAKADIVDWLYVDRPRRRMRGNYTACALLTREPPNEAAALKKRLGLTCKD
jgi:uncharacterized protein YegJ (DUF2314 family)